MEERGKTTRFNYRGLVCLVLQVPLDLLPTSRILTLLIRESEKIRNILSHNDFLTQVGHISLWEDSTITINRSMGIHHFLFRKKLLEMLFK